MERYCSSYYDRHGLYNDGFPCPGKTYCCTKDDGHKMCCPETDLNINKNNHQISTSTIIQRLLKTDKQQGFYNHLEDLSFNTNNNNRKMNIINPSGPFQLEPPTSSISFSITNSAQLLGVCLAFGALVVLTSLVLGFVFRYCTKSSRKSHNSEKASAHHHSTYSRNSSSSGSSNATSSTANNSPKSATEIDEEDLDECHKILTIDPNAHHLNQSNITRMQQPLTNNSQNLILQSNRSNNMSEYLLQTQRNSCTANNLNPIYSNLNQTNGHYTNAMSSGSSSICTSLLLNNLNNINSANTTQSFVFNSMSNNINENNLNLNLMNGFSKTDDEENTEDEADCEPNDFISSTTSNLEFLKTHSVFNSTPMNYYPTLGLSLNKPVPTVVETQPIYSEVKKSIHNTNTQTTNQTNPGDFRFSTFLPTTATATATSTTTAIYVNKQNDLI